MTSVGMVYQESHELGMFAMLSLGGRATRRGVTTVDFMVREGDIRSPTQNSAQETQVEILVMGYPTPSPGANILKLYGLEELY